MRRGLRYEADADERWLRAWEPYTTLKMPVRYEHALYATGSGGSITIARFSVPTEVMAPSGGVAEVDASAWICIAQDLRIDTFCSSGPGGQSVNTIPAPIVVVNAPSVTSTKTHALPIAAKIASAGL